MRIVIIGAVAAGTAAAAKASRNAPDAQIIVYEKDSDISYSGCGLPYFLSGEITDIAEIVPRDAAYFKKAYGVDVFTEHEVLSVDAKAKTLRVKNLKTKETFEDSFDKLIIATGAAAKLPDIPGTGQEHVFSLRSVQDARRMQLFIEARKPRKAVIAGTGFIGLEMLESLSALNISVTLLEKGERIARHLDAEMSDHLKKLLEAKGVNIHLSARLSSINADQVDLTSGETLPADMVLLATGVTPNTRLAADMELSLSMNGAIRVNERMETSIPGIYACGDCIETFLSINKQPVYKPLGSTAAKTGRIAGENATGGDMRYRGNLGTGIFRVFEWAVASTGLTQKEAEKAGYTAAVCLHSQPDRPEYLGGQEMLIKAIADKTTGRLLGAQIIGVDGVDKRIDVLAALITCGAKAEDLSHIDLAYAPPFSTTRDPVHYTGMLLESALKKG